MGKEAKSGLLPASEIVIPLGREADYCQERGIEFRRLSNGIKIIGMTCEVSDTRRSNVEIFFPSGAFYDPEGKEGLHHLVEHLINPRVREAAESQGVYVNACTDFLGLRGLYGGTVNPEYEDYGLLPVLPVVFEALVSPVGLHEDPQQLIENTKSSIIGEINEKNGDQDKHVSQFLNQVVYCPQSPFRANVLGTPESLRNITEEDVARTVEESFISQGMIISVYSEGNRQICLATTERLEELFRSFPREKKPRRETRPDLWEEINPDFLPGRVYEFDTQLKNNQLSFLFAWAFKNQPISEEGYAIRWLIDILHERYFRYCRRQGFGYTSFAALEKLGLSTDVVYLRADLPRTEIGEIDRFLKSLKDGSRSVIATLDKQQLQGIVKQRQKGVKANPWLIRNQLALEEWGLEWQDRIFDLDFVERLNQSITPEALEKSQEKLLATAPAVLIVGDLG